MDLLDPDKMEVIGDLAMSCFPAVLGTEAGLDQRRTGEEGHDYKVPLSAQSLAQSKL